MKTKNLALLVLFSFLLASGNATATEDGPQTDCRAIKSERNLETFAAVVLALKNYKEVCDSYSKVAANLKKGTDHPTKLDEPTLEALELIFANNNNDDSDDNAGDSKEDPAKTEPISDEEKIEFFGKVFPVTTSANEYLCKNTIVGFEQSLKETADQARKTGPRRMDLTNMLKNIITAIGKISINDIPNLQSTIDSLQQKRSKMVLLSQLESADAISSSLKEALEGEVAKYEEGIKALKECRDSNIREI